MSRNEESQKTREFLAGGLLYLLSKKHYGLFRGWNERREKKLGKGTFVMNVWKSRN